MVSERDIPIFAAMARIKQSVKVIAVIPAIRPFTNRIYTDEFMWQTKSKSLRQVYYLTYSAFDPVEDRTLAPCKVHVKNSELSLKVVYTMMMANDGYILWKLLTYISNAYGTKIPPFLKSFGCFTNRRNITQRVLICDFYKKKVCHQSG